MEKKTKNEKMRVAKLISNSGFSSRRDAEKLIIEKRVKLNGKIIESPAINIDKNSIIVGALKKSFLQGKLKYLIVGDDFSRGNL